MIFILFKDILWWIWNSFVKWINIDKIHIRNGPNGIPRILKSTRHIPLRAREYHARHASEQTMCLSYFFRACNYLFANFVHHGKKCITLKDTFSNVSHCWTAYLRLPVGFIPILRDITGEVSDVKYIRQVVWLFEFF